MKIATVGLDLAKTLFQVHGVDSQGHTVVRKQLRRADVLAFFAKLEPCVVGMEACGSSHYWGRAYRCAESAPSMIGPINLDMKQTGKPSAGKPHARFDVAGAGNVTMAAGLRPTVKAVERPPEPTVRAPVFDPTFGGLVSERKRGYPLEQDHRAIKRRTRPMLGFKKFRCACIVLGGIEVMHMIVKGQLNDGGVGANSRTAILFAGWIRNPYHIGLGRPLALTATEPAHGLRTNLHLVCGNHRLPLVVSVQRLARQGFGGIGIGLF
ncbi:hypothetical protein BN2475_1340002 [Paraburkholderia ribeironis]|uniref:Uncharacterized protein n=1 Tax=Paraburkholderia ribeironis TaxID=1247936 RepID=A0A1N7SPQ3_9BURK|nr:hypothetical protein BN2475_1340002 [Paraburkholderia ribeironis]